MELKNKNETGSIDILSRYISILSVGLKKDCKINKKLPEKTRVTVKLNENGFNDNLKHVKKMQNKLYLNIFKLASLEKL